MWERDEDNSWRCPALADLRAWHVIWRISLVGAWKYSAAGESTRRALESEIRGWLEAELGTRRVIGDGITALWAA